MYMSASLLASLVNGFDPSDGPTSSPKHDRLDDLESFYYSLFDIMHTRHEDGELRDLDGPQLLRLVQELQAFAENNPQASMSAKRSHFLPREFNDDSIADGWAGPSIKVLRRMFEIMRPIVVDKGAFLSINSDSKIAGIKEVTGRVETVYEEILESFDESIVELRKMVLDDEPPSVLDEDYEEGSEEGYETESGGEGDEPDNDEDEAAGTDIAQDEGGANGTLMTSFLQTVDEEDSEADAVEEPTSTNPPGALHADNTADLPPTLNSGPVSRQKRPSEALDVDSSDDESPFTDRDKRARTSSGYRSTTSKK